MSKLVVVVGATGGQGGSVVSWLLDHTPYLVRGLTRDVNRAQARSLEARGVNMVEADLDDETSLTTAFEGASFIFAMTNFFDLFETESADMSMAAEFRRGVNLANAASKTMTLEHFIWSTLPNSNELSNGSIQIPHTDAKSQVDDHIRGIPGLLAKTTFFWPAFFTDTLTHAMMIPNHLRSAGKYVWLQPCSPETPITTIGDHKANAGIFVGAIFANPGLTLGGKYVLGSIETLTMKEFLKRWSAVTGKEAVYVQTSLAEYEALWPKWGTEVGLNLMLYELCGHQSWSSKGWLDADALGIDKNDLTGLEQSLKSIDWSTF